MNYTLFDNETIKNELFQAYYVARKNKRNTINALAFELHLEHNLLTLYQEIVEYRYQLSPLICFIVDKPVKREIFASHFRDRVVHHLIINKLLPILENQFIYDNYSCRKKKGTLFGIGRLEHFIRSCTENFTKDAYILKLDIQGFFMTINQDLLYQQLETLVHKKYHEDDKDLLLYLIEKVVKTDPTKNCIKKGSPADWDGLPENKSLFYAKPNCGLPIGNVTSQIFANYYLTDFDRFIKEKLHLRYYGRYVDDFFIVHRDKEYLKSIIPILADYLQQTVNATLHPKKIYLQSCAKGVSYLGVYVKPYRSYVAKRTKANFHSHTADIIKKIDDHSQNEKPFYKEDFKEIEATINSYIGVCGHFKNYRFCLHQRLKLPTEVLNRV